MRRMGQPELSVSTALLMLRCEPPGLDPGASLEARTVLTAESAVDGGVPALPPGARLHRLAPLGERGGDERLLPWVVPQDRGHDHAGRAAAARADRRPR